MCKSKDSNGGRFSPQTNKQIKKEGKKEGKREEDQTSVAGWMVTVWIKRRSRVSVCGSSYVIMVI